MLRSRLWPIGAPVLILLCLHLLCDGQVRAAVHANRSVYGEWTGQLLTLALPSGRFNPLVCRNLGFRRPFRIVHDGRPSLAGDYASEMRCATYSSERDSTWIRFDAQYSSFVEPFAGAGALLLLVRTLFLSDLFDGECEVAGLQGRCRMYLGCSLESQARIVAPTEARISAAREWSACP